MIVEIDDSHHFAEDTFNAILVNLKKDIQQYIITSDNSFRKIASNVAWKYVLPKKLLPTFPK